MPISAQDESTLETLCSLTSRGPVELVVKGASVDGNGTNNEVAFFRGEAVTLYKHESPASELRVACDPLAVAF